MPGFLSLAQLPVVFLFSSKNSILSLLLGPGVGYEKLNLLHRWSGRVLFLTVTLHGALWMNNQLKYGLPILGQDKFMTGIAAFSFLALIVLTSLRPARIFIYQTFISLQWVSYIFPLPANEFMPYFQSRFCRCFLRRYLLPYAICHPVDLSTCSYIWT